MSFDEQTTNNVASHSNKKPFYMIGIGASAGGLDALERLFENMPENIEAAFVVIQHLSPHYKSFMAELLGKRTNMSISKIEEGLEVEPNHIYLNPPKHYVRMRNHRFILTEYSDNERLHLPIDVFFESLAFEYQRKAIGVILSGTGSDGTKGIRTIHQMGGLVVVQDESSAEFSGMPMSAVATGIVNYVRSPEGIVEEIMKHLMELSPEDSANEEPVSEEEYLQKIFHSIKQHAGVDFSGYKKAGIMRRIERRMKIYNMDSLSKYLDYLYGTPDEISLLQKDMLIGVTHFFRDPEAFAVISDKVIPEIVSFKMKDNGEIRMWVAGCSSGEEAYTLAMLLKHYMISHGIDLDVRIFATDLDKEAVHYASQGVYPVSAAEQIPKSYLDHYFVRKGDTYQVHKDIRKMIVFAPHNIIKDPPFVNLDLVTCRNMMIYFQPEIQRKVLSLFHFSLRSQGFLFLGPSESLGKLEHLYSLIDRKWNIFKNHDTNTAPIDYSIAAQSEVSDKAAAAPKEAVLPKELLKQTRLDEIALTLLEEYLPPSVIIDNQNNIVYTGGDLSRFLTFPKGRTSLNIFKMVSTPLSVAISTGIHKVRKNKLRQASFTIKPDSGVNGPSTKIVIKPFSEEKFHLSLLIVTFEEDTSQLSPPLSPEEIDVNNNAAIRIRELERELQYAQESLQATIEELETSNEELQSTNEELIASNEELQSTNEELQSVNEELITVNAEHQRKIQELVELNNDMDNFLVSTKIGTLFLDNNMCIRRFTPAVTSFINVMDIDIGRPINHLSHLLKYDDMYEDAQRVLQTTTPFHKEIMSREGSWFSMTILPYRTMLNSIQGVVITFVNITELKNANKELKKLSYAIHQSPSIISISDTDGIIEYINQTFIDKTGYSSHELVGHSIFDLSPEDVQLREARKEIFELLKKGKSWSGEFKNRRKTGETFWESASFLPIRNDHGEVVHFLKAAEDITERKHTEELLRKSEMLSAVGELAAGIAHEIRNPLTALKGFIQLMQSQGDGNQSYFSIMLSEFGRIEMIINELLLLSKPHALSFQNTDLMQILNHVLMLIETQALLASVTVKPFLEDSLPSVICVENQIKQVLINIMKNAIEAMPDGGQVSVTAKRHNDSFVLIRIKDNGPGISDSLVSRLGEPFYTTKESGTGLGLMVSFKIIENHNGKMSISSEEGKGTTVDIYLPTGTNES